MNNLGITAGIAGEFRAIVRRADGSVKTDTGFIKNLVLDNGLKAMGGVTPVNNSGVETVKSYSAFAGCVVGSGNNEPTATDIALANHLSTSTNTVSQLSGIEQPDDDHPTHAVVWAERTYVFTDVVGNVSEVGLVGYSGDDYINSQSYPKSYVLLTRALVKSSDGRAIAITVLAGETLEIVYRLRIYVDVSRQTGSFVLAGKDSNNQYDYIMQPTLVQQSTYIGMISFPEYSIETATYGALADDDKELTSPEWEAVQYGKANFTTLVGGKLISGYSNGNKTSSSYRRIRESVIDFDGSKVNVKAVYEHGIYTHNHNNGIRAFTFNIAMGGDLLVRSLVVVRNKTDGSGIMKTSREQLVLEFTMSFGRYGG